MTTPEPERKIRAIVFSDIKGYSLLMGEDESLALRLLDEHNAVCTPLIAQHGGTILKFIGDAILSSFESAADAVNYSIAVQRALAVRNAGHPDRERITVRIGIHIGDVVLKDGDVFGDGVNIAARIEPLAEPGGIAISQTVYDMIRARPEIHTVSLGPKELKNIKESVNIYKVLLESQAGPGDSKPPARPGAGRAALAAAATLLAAAAAGLWLFRSRINDARNNLLSNPGFEQGSVGWTSQETPVNIGDAAAEAHSGLRYAEAFLAPGKRSTTVWAADAAGKTMRFAVVPGDVVTFGSWVYSASGDERVGCKLLAADEGEKYDSWIAPAETELKPRTWARQRGSYTVQPGKAFVSFFVEVLAADDVTAHSVTVGRFDDVFLRIDHPKRRS